MPQKVLIGHVRKSSSCEVEGEEMKLFCRSLSLTGLLFGTFLLMISSSQAASPWKWAKTLQGPSAQEFMMMPVSLYIDEERQRYYVVDSGRNGLFSFDRQGQFLHFFSADGGLQSPFDMVRDKTGLLWVVEKGRNSLTSIDLLTKEVIPHAVRDGERLIVPDRIDYANGLFYLLDRNTGKIATLDSALTVRNWFSCSDCSGAVIDFKVKADSVWALMQPGAVVAQFSGEGKVLKRFAVDHEVSFAVSLEIGPSGMLYVLDRHEGSVSVFDSDGEFKYRFLARGQARGELYYPVEILFDAWGDLCVVEEGNGRVEVFER